MIWSHCLCETIDIDFYGHISSKMAAFCSKRISTVTGQVSLMPQTAVLKVGAKTARVIDLRVVPWIALQLRLYVSAGLCRTVQWNTVQCTLQYELCSDVWSVRCKKLITSRGRPMVLHKGGRGKGGEEKRGGRGQGELLGSRGGGRGGPGGSPLSGYWRKEAG